VLPPLSAGNCGSLGDIRVVNAVARCCVGPPDETGSRGTLADFEVAVVGNSWSVCRERRRGASVRRDETGTVGRHRVVANVVVVGAAGESAGAQSADVAVADAVNERGRPLGVRAVH